MNGKRNLLWEHNLRNIMNIFVVCDILWLDFEKAKKVISEFKPLEHRMELVWTFGWVTYYNDSIATIPASTINSLKSIQNVNTLILWWMDRWIDYSDLIDFVNSSNVENVICLPKTGHDLLPEIDKKTYKVDNLPEAVEIAKQVTNNRMNIIMYLEKTKPIILHIKKARTKVTKKAITIEITIVTVGSQPNFNAI